MKKFLLYYLTLISVAIFVPLIFVAMQGYGLVSTAAAAAWGIDLCVVLWSVFKYLEKEWK